MSIFLSTTMHTQFLAPLAYSSHLARSQTSGSLFGNCIRKYQVDVENYSEQLPGSPRYPGHHADKFRLRKLHVIWQQVPPGRSSELDFLQITFKFHQFS